MGLRTWLAAFRTEFSFVDDAAFASPFVADGFWFAALRAEFALVYSTASRTFPFVDDGFWFAAFRAEFAAVAVVAAS